MRLVWYLHYERQKWWNISIWSGWLCSFIVGGKIAAFPVVCCVGVSGMSVEEEEWKDVNHYYTICRTDIEGPLPQFVDVPCNTIDHVETELWERLVYKHPISKLEYQIHGKSNANRLETRVEHGSVYNWVKAESEQVLLGRDWKKGWVIELPTVSKFSQGEDLSMLLSVTTTNNKTTIIALSSQLYFYWFATLLTCRLERIDFALLEKNQFSRTHVVIGFWGTKFLRLS